ncbi:hypothetical protein H6P81_014994 [Aristolochia fimbriata]|uniref:Methyltransferase type 11 domain-containing protein n=1 Tax=Aristolochia fimbriata TaxID=158543 RepID=A0AAV7E544_ARIFI|nr:hypothetical protein H6P81_014994 [Aristolochia fimbriata]
MANLHWQSDFYAETRPTYPDALFEFIASKTPNRHFAWDAGCGTGQAATALARIYENVVGTDTNEQQLSRATKLPNVRYGRTSAAMSIPELEQAVGPRASADLVTVAQAFHWFDPPSFYEHVNWVLRKPHGVVAVWCYTSPVVDDAVGAVFQRLYEVHTKPFWAPERQIVDDRYTTFDFPFDPVEGEDHTGPFEFEAATRMNLEKFLTYIRSWSAYETAKEKGVELLNGELVEDFRRAWGGDGGEFKVVKFPVYLRIGRVRD